MFDFKKTQAACQGCYSAAEKSGMPTFRVINANHQPYCLFLTDIDMAMFEKEGKNFYDICPYLSSYMIEAKEARYEPPKDPNDTNIMDAVLRRGCNWPLIFKRNKKKGGKNGTQ